MSEKIDRWDYKRMLKRRVKLIEKKLHEIEEIKIKYGTVPSLCSDKVLKVLHENQKYLED